MTRIATQLAALSLVALSACTTSEMGFTHYSDGTPVEPEATESSETLDIPGQAAELADEPSAAPLAACSIEGERLSVVWAEAEDASSNMVVATSTEARSMAIAKDSGILELWSLDGSTYRSQLQAEIGHNASHIAYSASGKEVVVNSAVGIEVIDAENGERLAVGPRGEGQVSAIASTWGPTQIHTAVATDEGVSLWRADQAKASELGIALDSTETLSFLGNSAHLIGGGSYQGQAALALYANGHDPIVNTLPFDGSTGTILELTDGRYLMAGVSEGEGFLVDAKVTFAEGVRFGNSNVAERSIEQAYELDTAIATYGEGRLELWNTSTLDSLGGFELGAVVTATIDLDDESVYAIYADGTRARLQCLR